MILRRWLFVLMACGPGVSWSVPNVAERARIERLIQFVENHKTAKFVRNGKVYSGSEAGQFLRAKLNKMGEHVNQAQDFIDQIASVSSTTGAPYVIRFPDGKEIPAAQFWGDELKRMDR